MTFDIDANGIVHVSAKDLGTGKEQSIKITASSGLSEEEIKNMVKDAEVHAEEDKNRKAAAEARNQLDSLVYSTEKSLKEYGDDLEDEVKSGIEEALEKAKKALEGDDTAAMQAAAEELNEASHKLAEAMYAKASQQQGPQDPTQQPPPGASDGKPDDNVVDADFEEVKEEVKD